MIKYLDISYSLLQSSRKTMSIYVETGGKVVVHAPNSISIDKINTIIDLKKYWIYQSMAELEDLNKTRVLRTVTDGEGFLYLGRSYRLKIGNNLKRPLSLSGRFFNLDERYVDKAKQLFVTFYREQGKKHIPNRVKYFQKKVGKNIQIVRVMDLQNRWASRSKRGLNFHWKLMLAPMAIIDYVIVHELAHYLKEGHSTEFWETVESMMPNFKENKNWLRLNGASLDI